MKINIIFKDGHEKDIYLFPEGAGFYTSSEAIEIAKAFVQSHMKLKLEDVKSYEVAEGLSVKWKGNPWATAERN